MMVDVPLWDISKNLRQKEISGSPGKVAPGARFPKEFISQDKKAQAVLIK